MARHRPTGGHPGYTPVELAAEHDASTRGAHRLAPPSPLARGRIVMAAMAAGAVVAGGASLYSGAPGSDPLTDVTPLAAGSDADLGGALPESGTPTSPDGQDRQRTSGNEQGANQADDASSRDDSERNGMGGSMPAAEVLALPKSGGADETAGNAAASTASSDPEPGNNAPAAGSSPDAAAESTGGLSSLANAASAAEAGLEAARQDLAGELEAAKSAQQAAMQRVNGSDGGEVVPGVADFVKPAQGRYTSGYGGRWGHFHYGVDIANSIGTPIRSTAAGTVISAGPASGFGMWVRVRHDDGTITVYGHIHRALVEVGERVQAGTEIAEMGNRGFSTGPHLHFEVWLDGEKKVDPKGWLNERGITLT